MLQGPRDLAPGQYVENARGLIGTGRDNAAAVGAELRPEYLVLMLKRDGHRLARRRVPDMCRLVLAGRDDAAAVRAESRVIDFARVEEALRQSWQLGESPVVGQPMAMQNLHLGRPVPGQRLDQPEQ